MSPNFPESQRIDSKRTATAETNTIAGGVSTRYCSMKTRGSIRDSPRTRNRGDHLHECGFPRAIRPEQANNAGLHFQREIAHSEISRTKSFRNALDFQHSELLRNDDQGHEHTCDPL